MGVRGGQALASKVDQEYFRWLGSRGGRKTQFNILIYLSQNFEFVPLPGGNTTAAAIERATQRMREHYRSEAYEKYYFDQGTRVMLQVHEPGTGSKKTWRGRRQMEQDWTVLPPE